MKQLLNNTNGYDGFFPGDHVLLAHSVLDANKKGIVITIEQYQRERPNRPDPINRDGGLTWLPVREENGDANGWNPEMVTLVRRGCRLIVVGNELRMEAE